MGFGDLKSKAGQQSLNSFLSDRSYIEGYVPSQADVVVFTALGSKPSDDLPHALRWYNHISSYGKDKTAFPGVKKDVGEYGAAAVDDDDDDIDLFGSDDEDEQEELKKKRQQEVDAKKGKKVVIAKSSIVLDVKPWDDETDMAELEKEVRSIKMDGLVWGASRLQPVGYGIKKLQIGAVVEDDKVSVDLLEESITAFEDYVQSVDVAAFQKV